MLLKFSLLCGKQLNLCWTMSRWYVTPVCLPAHCEIGNLGGGGREGQPLSLPYGSRPAPWLSVKLPMANVSQKPPGGLWSRWCSPQARAVKRSSLQRGHGVRLTVPQWRAGPCMRRGVGLEAGQQGLTLHSFDQQQHSLIPGNICNPQH